MVYYVPQDYEGWVNIATNQYEECGIIYFLYDDEINEHTKHAISYNSLLARGNRIASYSWDKTGEYNRIMYSDGACPSHGSFFFFLAMTTIYHELLPESYLIILAPARDGESEAALEHQLKCAERSGKSAVWVDCGMLHSLSAEAARLLWGLHHYLREQRAELVLVHVPEPVKTVLLNQEAGPAPCIVPTLLDAARQARWQQWRCQQHLA